MSDYQKVLLDIKQYIESNWQLLEKICNGYERKDKIVGKWLDTLQELIDKYYKVVSDYKLNGCVPYYIYKELKDELDEYRKKEKKIVNKNLKRAYKLMKESGYFDE